MKTFNEVDGLLIGEYLLLMEAQRLKNLERQRDIHFLAFTNEVAKATKTKGKKTYSLYPNFKSFFDYEKHLDDILGPRDTQTQIQSELDRLLLIANSKGG